MTKKPARANMKWTKAEEAKLIELNKKKLATKKIAEELERTESAVRARASELEVSLKPKDPRK
jgi:DNA-binding NarL/FixJ family response regulator